MKIAPPARRVFEEKIIELLESRNGHEAALKGIITKDEAVLLVFRHFQTLITDRCRQSEDENLKYEVDDILTKLKKALFKD